MYRASTYDVRGESTLGIPSTFLFLGCIRTLDAEREREREREREGEGETKQASMRAGKRVSE